MTRAIVFDTEATDKDEPELIGAAWVEFESENDDLLGAPSDAIKFPLVIKPYTNSYCEKFKPTKPISYGAMAVHHILPIELENKPPSSEFALPDDVDIIIGHNIDFDWEVVGRPDVRRICTDAISRHVWPEADAFSQSALIYMLEGPTDKTRKRLKEAHSAYWDVLNNATLVEHILKERPDILTWTQFHEFSEYCRIPIVCPLGKWKGTPIADLPNLD